VALGQRSGEMKHHQQQSHMLRGHHHHLQPQPVSPPFVVVPSAPTATPLIASVPTSKRHSSSGEGIHALAIVGVLFIFLFLVYLVSMTLSSNHMLLHHGEDGSHGASSSRMRGSWNGGRGPSGGFDGDDTTVDEGKCIHQLEQEKRIKASLIDQVKQLEADLTEERRKYRELEQDYRDLALSARAQQAQKPVAQPQGDGTDVSAMQRLAKCRSAVEESTQTIKDLREHNKNLDVQVTRLQKELREAISDADEQERIAAECEKKLRSTGSKPASSGSAHPVPPLKPPLPPPPLPGDDDD